MASEQDGNRTVAGRFPAGASGNPKGRPKRMDDATYAERRGQILARLDGWSNAQTGMGMLGRDKAVRTGFASDVIDSETGADIWRGDPIGARIVEVPPNEALRQSYELCIGDDTIEPYEVPEAQPAQPGNALMAARGTPQDLKQTIKRNDSLPAFARRHPSAFARKFSAAVARQRRDAGTDAKPLQEKITRRLEDLQANQFIREAMHFERAVCAGAILIGANDYTTDLREPLDLRKVRSLDYLTPIEARELMPLYFYNDPFKPKFGQVAIYQLVPQLVGNSIDWSYRPNVTQIHESRLIVFPGIKTTRRALSGVQPGFGDNIFTRVWRALRAFNSANHNAEVLLADFAQAVYKIKDLAGLMQRDKNALTDSMMNVEMSRAIARAIIIDSEEEFKRESTSLAGYSDVMAGLGTFLCSAADIPAILLLSTSPNGLNATGDAHVRLFYDRAATTQTARVAPAVMRLVEICIAAEGQDPDTVNHSVEFTELWQPTELEGAQARYAQAQTDALYCDSLGQTLSPEEIALSAFGGKRYSFARHVDFEARRLQNAVVPPPVDAQPKPEPPPMLGADQYGRPLPLATTQPVAKNAPTIEE